jgi:hypothetical protein
MGIRAKGGGGVGAPRGRGISTRMQEESRMRAPLYIRMRDEDNVAIVVIQRGLHPGAVFADGLQLVEQIPARP